MILLWDRGRNIDGIGASCHASELSCYFPVQALCMFNDTKSLGMREFLAISWPPFLTLMLPIGPSFWTVFSPFFVAMIDFRQLQSGHIGQRICILGSVSAVAAVLFSLLDIK